MKVGHLLFTYGTLKQGRGAHSYLAGRSDYLGETRITGKLYDLGAYPGFKTVVDSTVPGEPLPFISEGPTVAGELYRITDENLPRMLDSYEGYPHLYDRTRIQTEAGEPAWVYCYRGRYDEAQLVPTGEW